MGEDIDDFVVRTKSKTDQIIRDYTSVASNAHKGVSVLDENGNLRNTYDIMLDIAKVYKEIQEEDKQYGTNRAQALVETLAGKNRSNIAASILNNPELLESAYESSQNAAGTGQKELDIYLDSLEAHLAKLQNRISELATITFDSSWLKIIVDLATQAVEAFNSLGKSVGGAKLAVSAIAGIFLQKNGLGLLNYNKQNGFSSIFSNMIKSSQKASVVIPANFNKIIDAVNRNTTDEGRQNGLINWGGFFAKHDVKDTNLQAFLKDTSFPTKDLENYIQYTQQAQAATGRFTSVLSNLGSIGATVLSTLATQAAIMAAMWLTGEIIKGIHDLIMADEIAIEKGKEATKVIEDQFKSYQDLNNTLQDMGKSASGKKDITGTSEAITEIAEKYSELHDGVNELTNANESLSNEKYQEYLDISNQIAEQFPSLVSGYDDQGNAILNIGNSATQAEQALKRMYEASKLAANVSIMDNLQDSYKGYATQIKQKVEENDKLTERNSELQKNIRDNQVEQILGNSEQWAEINGESITIKGFSLEKESRLRDVLGKHGIVPDFSVVGTPKIGEDATALAGGISALSKETISSIQQQLYDGVKSSLETSESAMQQEILSNNNKITSNELFIKDQRKAITSIMSDALQTSDIFGSQSSAIQNAILGNMGKLNLSGLTTTYDGDIYSFLYGEIIEPINELKPEAQNALDELLEIDTNKMSAGEYVETIQSGLADIFNNNPTDIQRWKNFLGFDTIFGEVSSAFSDIKGEFLIDGATPMSQADIEAMYGLSLDDLRTYADLVRTGVYETWQDLQKAFEDMEKPSKTQKDGTLIDLFNNEDYKNSVEEYEKSLSSLTSALETIRTEGELSSEAQKDLIEQFPDLAKEAEKTGGQITESMVQDEATDKLSAWVKTIREAMKGMSPKEQSGAKEYIEDLITSYGELADTARDAKDLFVDLYAPDDKDVISHEQRKEVARQFDSSLLALKSQLGDEELDMDVVYTLVAMDMFSGTAEEIKANYDDVKLKWDIELGNAEELKRIQKDLEVEESKKGLIEAKQNKKEVTGKDLTEQDYKEKGESLANTTQLRKSEEEIAQENYDAAFEAYEKRKEKYEESQSTFDKLKQKGGIPSSVLQDMQKTQESDLQNTETYLKDKQKELNDAETNTVNAEVEEIQNRIDKYQSESKTLQNAYTELEDGANQIQNNLKKREKLGMDYTKGEYQELINNASEQMNNIDLQIKAKERELIRYKYDKDIGVDSNLYREAEAAITELEGKQIDLKQQTQEWQTMISTGIELNQTKRDLEDLQTDATNIQDAMSFRETRGLKATVKDYQKLMKNSAEQIKNIKTQNDLLRQQQAELITNNGVAAMQSSTYRDIQAQIESNNQSLRGLAQNQYDWGKQMATGQIQNIMDSMSAAQQAMSTGHLADTDTLKNLITMNRDYASALVTTTTGTYVDAQAMAKLAEDQGDLTIAMIDAQKAAEMMNYEANVDQMMSMAQQIDPTITSIQQLNQALAEHPDSPEWSKILDLSDANFNIQTTLDQLQAMKEQVLATQSYLGQYQMAQSSWNFSDPMQQIRGGLEGAKQLYDQGWWGKDDFTSFAKLIATNEQIEKDTFVDNFMENYNKAQKYLTEDRTGVENWISKMREEGYVDEKGDFDIKSMERFANDMGFNTEFSEYMLMAMKDAGYQVDISRLGDKYAESYKQITGTEANAGLQMKTLLSEMEQTAKAGGDIRTSAEQAGAALQRMKDAGASDEAISDLVEQYNELGNLTGFHIDPQTLEVTTTVDKSELEETEEEINKPKDMMVQIKEEYDISDEDITETNNAIQRAFEGNKANLDQELKSSGLSDYSAEDLLKIDFEDGQYLPDTAEAESALENLAVKIGLVGSKSEVTNDVANALVATLLELNSISGETQAPVSEADQTRAERFDLQKKQSSSEEPLYNRVVSEASQLSDSSAHSFLATEQENLKSQEITYKIKTELEGGATMNDLAKLTDEEIMTTFHCDASEVDEVRSKIEEMANSDGVDFTVKINEDQLTDFGTTISDAVKNALTGVDSSEATTAIEEITTSYEELETAMSGEPLKIEIDTDGAVESLENLKEAMEELGITPNKGNAEGTEDSTAPPTNYSNTNKNNTKTNYKQSSNTVSQETSGSVESTSVEGGEVHVPGVVDVNEADTSAIEGEEVEMDGTATFTADTSGLEAAEAEASTPIEKDVHLNVVNSRLEGDTSTPENTEQTVTTNEVKNTEENNTITTKIKTEADTSGADEAKAAVEKVPREWRTRLSADDGTSGPARAAAEAIRDIPLSWSSSITATTTGLEAVTTLKEAIDKLQDKEITIKATTVNVDGTTTTSSSSKIETENTTAGGKIIKVNGTAHATGTAFPSSPAHAKGVNWAIENDETALVNELGTEGLVRDGRFYQIPGGAQYINLKRGDIIFNHKQVEELNKHGHVISGGGHGKAYANGTLQSIPAHGGDSTASGNVNSNGWKASGGGDSGGGGGGGASVAATNDNTNALNQNTTSTNNNTGSTTQAAKNVESNLDKFKKWADSLFDWIEVRMERLQHSIDMNTAQSELNTTYQKKNSEINAAMKTTEEMIKYQNEGATRYEKQAGIVAKKAVSMGALSQGEVNKLVKLIQDGAINIESYKARKKPSSSSSDSSSSDSGEETPELTFIEEYKEWWDKGQEMRLSILENKQALKDLAQTKLDNIIDQFDTIVGLSEQLQSNADAQKQNLLINGKNMRSQKVEDTVKARVKEQQKITKARENEEKAYAKELKQAEKRFGKNSNQYREAQSRLEEVRTAKTESKTAERQIQLDYQEERLQSIQDKWETLAGYAASVQSSSESLANFLESQKVGNVLTSPYEKEIKQQQAQAKAQRNYYKKEMDYYAEEMKRAEKLYGKDSNDYIDAKKNFEEMRKNHYDASQQIIEIEKNYQQKRLDVIKEKWDSFINLAEARQGTAKAKEGLYNAQGKRLNGTEIKDTYLDQRYQQDQITQYYKKQYNDLNAERSRMKKVYGVDSNEYREWQASLEAAAKGWRESETAAYDLQRSFLDLNAQVMNFDITKLQHGIERIANAVSLKEKRGTRVGEMNDPITDNDYTRQIDANQKQIRLQRKMAEYYRLQQTGLDENSKQYMEFEQKIYGCENAMDSLNMQNEELKESARNNRWKSFYELSDQIDVIVSDYSHLIGLMNEESFFDDNGNDYQLTMNGLSAIAMYGEQIEANRQKVALYQEGLKALNEELANNMISEQKFAEDQKKLLGGIQESVNAMKSEKEAIIGLAKTQMTNEANVLKKIIQNRKDALSAKKA